MLFNLFDTVPVLLFESAITLNISNLVLYFLRPNRPGWTMTLGLTEQLSILRQVSHRGYFAVI